MRRTPKAFTLIEALVVVALIVLLISLLVPALNGAKQLARMTVCQSTMKNLYEAYRLASMDTNQGRWLVTGTGPWTLIVRTYMNGTNRTTSPTSTNVLSPAYPQARNNADGGSKMICPNDWPYWQVNVAATNVPCTWSYGPYGTGPGQYYKTSIQPYASYAGNMGAVGDVQVRVLDCCPIGKHQFPAAGILLAENGPVVPSQRDPSNPVPLPDYITTLSVAVGGSPLPYGLGISGWDPGYHLPQDEGHFGTDRHQGRGNLAYLDGHVDSRVLNDNYNHTKDVYFAAYNENAYELWYAMSVGTYGYSWWTAY